MGLLSEKITKYYIDSLISYRKLNEEIMGVNSADINEGKIMMEIMLRRKIQSSFAYELMNLTMDSAIFENNTFKIMEQLFGECGPELNLSKDVKYVTGKRLLPSMEKYFDHLRDLATFIRAEVEKLKLCKIYRAMSLTRKVFSTASLLPESVLEILLLQIDTGVGFITANVDPFPAEFDAPTLENCVLGNFEREFLCFLWNSFSLWHRTRELNEAMAFMDLPPRFLDVLLGYRKLVAITEKMILNEYCRTTAIIFIMTHFLQAVKSVQKRLALSSIVSNLRSSFHYIQGPKLSPTVDKRSYSQVIERFVDDVHRQCHALYKLFNYLCCDGTRWAYHRDIIYSAVRKCSFLKNMNIRLFTDPFSVLAMVEHLIDSARYCYGKNSQFRFSFHGDFAIRPEIFFSDGDFSVNLPLLSNEILETLITRSRNNERANVAAATSVESSRQLIRQMKISGSPMENKERES